MELEITCPRCSKAHTIKLLFLARYEAEADEYPDACGCGYTFTESDRTAWENEAVQEADERRSDAMINDAECAQSW